jgi:hypothetical protein
MRELGEFQAYHPNYTGIFTVAIDESGLIVRPLNGSWSRIDSWSFGVVVQGASCAVKTLLDESIAKQSATDIFNHWKERAVRAEEQLDNLRTILREIMGE